VETQLANYRPLARIVAWLGILVIIILSVVPAQERPVTAAGSIAEHFAIFAIVGAAFTIGYELSLIRLLFLALLFSGGIELLQIPLPTRHARMSDFIIDLAASGSAIACVFFARKILTHHRR